MSAFTNRKPKWPTLRGAKLPQADAIYNTYDVSILFAGVIEQPENVYGGFFAPTRVTIYPALSWEARMYVKRKKGPFRTVLYYLCWASEYMNGVIMHVGPQYPHVLDFEEDDVEKMAIKVFKKFACLAYKASGNEFDKDARKFLTSQGYDIRSNMEVIQPEELLNYTKNAFEKE